MRRDRIRKKRSWLLLGPLLWAAASMASADGVSAYLPLNLQPEIERAVERVLVLGDKPILVRPIPVRTVLEALPKACRRNRPLCRRVRAYLEQYNSTLAVTGASGEVAAHTGDDVALPNEHGLRANSTWDASAQAFFQPSQYLLLSGGYVGQPHDSKPTGTEVSVGTDVAQLDVGYRDHWFSPLTDSSTLISTEAPTMPSLTLSNPRPLTSAGFEYQLFLARMSYSDHIAWEGGYTAGYPRLAGAHFGIEPVAGWAFSGNATWQFGGGARPDSISDFLHSLFSATVLEPTGNGTTLETDTRFSNRALSLTSAYTFPTRVPFEAYVEYAGRDSFHFEVYRLRETSLSVGLHFPQLFNRFDFTAEVSQWQDNWFTDYVWQDGMVNDGFVVGGWGGDWRTYNNAVGAQSAMASLEWPLVSGDSVYVRYRTLQNQNYFGIDYDRAHMATIEYAQPRGAFTRGLQLDAGRDVYGDGFARLSAFLRFTPENEVGDDTAGAYQDDDDDDADTADVPKGLERFVDAGVSFGRFGMNVNFSTPKTYVSGTAPHLGIGVRRAVSDNNDFGVRAEFDNIDGRQMYEVRALDWRYRFGSHLAAGLFIGFADYQAPTPAQGYYAGGGLQWRSILPGWDLSFDLRDFDRIQRDKLLPSDGPTDGSVDEFWTMFGMSLYLSRHF